MFWKEITDSIGFAEGAFIAHAQRVPQASCSNTLLVAHCAASSKDRLTYSTEMHTQRLTQDPSQSFGGVVTTHYNVFVVICSSLFHCSSVFDVVESSTSKPVSRHASFVAASLLVVGMFGIIPGFALLTGSDRLNREVIPQLSIMRLIESG